VGKCVTPRPKPHEPLSNCINCCYNFQCICAIEYYGETSRRLSTRVKDHGRPSSYTAISDHIFDCKDFQDSQKEFVANYAGPLSVPQRKHKFLLEQFTIKGTNLSSWRERKVFEAVLINQHLPKLNEQVKSMEVKLL
jgi:hypothetical protein